MVLRTVVAAVLPLLTLLSAAQPYTAYGDPAVDAKIEIVWPHDQQGNLASVATAPLVNVEAYLFERGTLNPVRCDFPNRVVLRWARSFPGPTGPSIGFQEPARDYQAWPGHAVGQRVIREASGRTFSAWVFNDVPIFQGQGSFGPNFEPNFQVWNHYFFVEVEGADYRTNVWAHGANPLTYVPYGPLPEHLQGSPRPLEVDARVSVVWPHDPQGSPRAITDATLVNIGVDIGEHRDLPGRTEATWKTVSGLFTPTVWLLRSLNSGFLEPIRPADEKTTVTVFARPLTISWPRWVFN